MIVVMVRAHISISKEWVVIFVATSIQKRPTFVLLAAIPLVAMQRELPVPINGQVAFLGTSH